jgi:hypothetical protein
MEVSGKIEFIGMTQAVSEKFSKRELVVTTDEQYPQSISIEFNQDKCTILDRYNLGDNVTVGVNLRGRKWLDPKTNENRYFNTIQGWMISKGESAPEKPQAESTQETVLPF